MIYWKYNIDDEKKPSKNIHMFLNLLELKKNIEFFTDSSFKFSSLDEELDKIYQIYSVGILGTVGYLKGKVNESFKQLRDYLESYVDSLEALDEKIYELSKARVSIKEFLLYNNIYDPIFLDIQLTVSLTNKDNNSIEVRWAQCKLSPIAIQEVQEHIHLRNTYAELLDHLCSLHIEKLKLFELQKSDLIKKEDSEKEIQLFEVWIGLSEMGFLDHLNSDLQITKCRKEFFEILGLKDKDYKNRNTSLKRRQFPKAIFLNSMCEKLEKYV